MAIIVAVIYIILLLIFLVISGLILRYTIKFSYLSPRFKKVIWIFGILSFFIILFSAYRLITLFHVDLNSVIPSLPAPGSGSPSGIKF